MLIREVTINAAVQEIATRRIAKIDALLPTVSTDEAIALNAERATLVDSWISERWIEDPNAITPEAQAVIDAANAAAAATAAATTKTLDQRASDALDALRVYRDKSSPSSGDTVAIVKIICRILIALIRFRLNKLDAAD